MLKQTSTIIIQARAEMIHRYKDAPEMVSFLRDYHRHELHITVELEVTHDDRELEFIMVKRELESFLIAGCDLHYVDKSCEMVAKEIYDWTVARCGERRAIITVSEDGENGGRLYVL